jgi:MFS family permease
VNAYLSLLRTPGVARIIGAQLTARFPSGMLSLGFLLHMQHIFGSYGSAGLVLAATSVGQAVSGPLTSRWMGQWGMRPVLLLTTCVCTLSLLTVALVPLPLVGYMIAGLVAGLSYPPVQPAVRTIYPKMVNARQLTPLFALDASAQEIIWIAGPVVVTFVSTQISTTVGILVSVVFLIGGGLWFLLSPEVGRVRIPRSRRKLGSVLTKGPVLLITVVGFLVVGACAATEAGVVATFGQGNSTSGVVLSIWALASLVGGLLLGHLPVAPGTLAKRVGLVAFGTTLAAIAIVIWTGSIAEFWTLSGALVIAGIGLAPALAVMFASVSSSVRFSDTAEAYGWVGTGQLIGAAAGSAVAGFLIDYIAGTHGASGLGGFIIAVVFALVGTLVPVIFRRHLPDLRGRDASPLADTEPVPAQPS